MPSSNSVKACARACSPAAPVVCTCSLLLGLSFNAGRATENSSEGVLRGWNVFCYQRGRKSEAGRLQWMIGSL